LKVLTLVGVILAPGVVDEMSTERSHASRAREKK
jgi:hypothetical protein